MHDWRRLTTKRNSEIMAWLKAKVGSTYDFFLYESDFHLLSSLYAVLGQRGKKKERGRYN